jgi:hypothetical protein
MPDYDVLTYHDLRTDDAYSIGDLAPQLGRPDYPEMHVVAVGPPIHPGKDASLVVAFRNTSMPVLQELLDSLGD